MGVMDRYNERNKKKDEEKTGGKSASGGVAERYERNQYYQTLDLDSVDENYINTFISDTNSFFSGVNQKAISYDVAKRTFGDLSTRYDTIQGWLYKNKSKLNEEAYTGLSTTFDGLKSNFDGLKDFYSQWDTQEDYDKFSMGWLDSDAETNDETSSKRKDYYQKNEDRIAEIKNDLPGIGDSFLPTFIEKWFLSDEQDALKDEMEAKKAENLQYKRTQGTLDEYYTPVTPEFQQNAAYRDYINPTREELHAFDVERRNSDEEIFSWDGENYRDQEGNIVNYSNDPGIQDKLGMFLSASDEDITEAYNELSTALGDGYHTWAGVMQEGDVNGWKHLKENEINIYYDLYKREGQEAAYRYLDAMTTELTRRATQEMTDYINEAPLLEQIALNAASIPATVFGGIPAFIDDMSHIVQGEDINPYSRAHSFTNAATDVRSKTAIDIDNLTGNVELPWVGTSFGDVYQSLMSAADSLVGSAIGGKAYSVFMGMGAASNEMRDLYEKGADINQIAAGGILAGAAEMVFEKVSIDKLVSMGDSKTIKAFIVNLLKQGGIEASEEMATEIANTITNIIVMGSQSDWVDAETFAKNVVNAGIGGFISGGASGGTFSAASYAQSDAQTRHTGRTIKYADGGMDALMSLANEVAGASEGRTQKQLNKQISAVEKNATNRRVGRLFDAVETTNNLNNATANKADIVKSLVRNNIDADTANEIAQALVDSYNGKALTEAQSSLLESVKGDYAVQNAISKIVANEQSTMGQRSQNIRKFSNEVSEGVVSKAVFDATGIDRTGKKTAAEEFTPKGEYEVSDNTKAFRTDTKEDIDIKGVASISKGEMLLDIGDGKTINSKDVSYASEQDALIYEAIANLGDKIDPKSANELFSLYDGKKSAALFARGIAQAYSFGFNQYDKSELASKSSFASDLTAEQRNEAYRLGKEYRSVKDRADKDNAHTTKAPAEKGVYYRDQNGNATDISTYLKSSNVKLNDRQKTAIEAMRKFSETMGARFSVFETWKENGKTYYLDENGVKQEGSPNGFYDPKTGEIYISLDAGAVSANKFHDTMLFTIAHELTHFMKQWSPEHFTKISKIVFAHAGFKGRVSELVAAKMEARKKKGKPISYDTAVEEVVADAMETILKDGKVVEFMAEVKQKDHTAWQKLKGWFKNLEKFLRKLVVAYRGEHANTTEGDMVANFAEETLRQIQQIWAEGAVAAGDNYQGAEAQKNTTDDGGVDGEYDIKLSPREENAFKQFAKAINSVVNQSISGKGNIDGKAQVKDIMPAGPRITAMVAASSGNAIDISQRNIALSSSDIWHEYKRHTQEKQEVSRGQVAFTKRQFQNAVKCIISPDIVETIFADTNNPTQRQSFAYAKKTVRGHYVVVEAVGGKKNPQIYPVLIVQFNKAKWNKMIAEGKSLGEMLHEGEPQKLMAQDVEKNKKSRVTAAQFASYEAIANTLHSSQLDTKVSQPEVDVKNESAEALDIEVDEKTESAAPSALMSEKTWSESDYVQEREKAAQEISKAIGVSVKKAKAYIDSVNSIAKMIAEDRVRLDYFSSPGRSSFVSNVEYGGSFDFSTLCKKRRLLTGTFTAIQKALPNTALTADEILKIRNRMKKAGLEVSCGLCYVEGSRANMGQFAKEFLKLYKQYYPDAWQPNLADVNTPDGIEWVRINHPECYDQYEYFWNHYGTLKPGDKNLFASQQKPKLYQLHTEYKGEILDKFNDDDNVEEKNLNGGIRLQSFSDFEIVHLIDTMQIIMDMSRVGLAGQAYTKVPDFAWALGDTGLKINLSLIAKGVDENGKLIFDDVEGMPIETAVALRNRYSKNVGTILVAFNDEQLLAAMADDRVDFIIPFHRSQWKKSQYEAMGLPAKTKDYTFMQNEKFIKPQYHEYRGRMVKDKATNYMPNEYWDFSKSGKENAEAYLEMCARNNKRPKFYKLLQNNGDGSYSLKADGSTDGYWKLLIDFKMYDNDGNGSPQMPVKPDFNMEEATRMLNEYKGGHSNFPVAQGIVDDFVQEYKDSHKGALYSDRDDVPTFYSQMAKVVDGVKQEKLGAASVVSMLRGKGVKAEEIKWSGIETWLEGKKSVTKAELQEFIAGSMLQIEEEILDNKDRPYTDDQQKRLDEYEAKRDEIAKRLADEWKKITGDEFPIRNAGAGLESAVVNKIIDANKEHKDASFEGRLLAKLRKDLQKVIEDNDDFGFDSWKDALRSIHRHRRDFINYYEISTNDKAVIVKYCNALNAYNELPNKISDADTDRLREIARETDPWNRKIMEVKNEHNEEEAKYMTNWAQYRLKGGRNYREMLFRIPGSTYTNESMMTHWKERTGVLAHARVQDLDTFLGKMLFIEEIQSDWHNAGRKDGYRDPGVDDKHTLSKKMEKYTDDFFASPIADMVRERIAPIGYEGAGTSMILNFLLDSEDSMKSTLNTLSRKGASFTESEVSEIAKYAREYEEMYHRWETAPGDLTAPDAPFKETYHEYVLKRLLREAAEQDYDSIGWTTAETQDERWQNNQPHKEGTGKSGFLKAYTIEYDQNIRNFLDRFGKKWGARVGKTTLDSGTEVWSMAITDSMKESVMTEGQALYSFRGEKALNIDKDALKEAKTLDKQGVPMKEIRSKTRWWKQSDGKWRNEFATKDFLEPKAFNRNGLPAAIEARIARFAEDEYLLVEPDYYTEEEANAVIERYAAKLRREGLSFGYLSEFLDAPELYEAYPHLKDIQLTFDSTGSKDGSFYPEGRGRISLRQSYAGTGKTGREVLLHEIQHAIQEYEGFSGGTTVKKAGSYDAYYNNKGEIEARDVESRWRYSEEERQDYDPVYFQDRTDDSVSNRSLLANALESAAKNDIERNKIQEYKSKIALIETEEKKLRELNAQIKELSFAEGPRDTKRIKDLRFDANQAANRINTYDKQLLRLEASKPLQDVLEREKKKAYQKAEKRGKEALAAQRERAAKTQRELLERWQDTRKKGIESREKTAMRHKIKSVVAELNQLLLNGDKKRHVPDSLKKAVADALALVNMDTVGAEERAAKYAALIANESDPDKIDAYTMKMENILRQGEKMGQRLKELRDAYEEISESDDPDIANAYDPVIAGSLKELAQSIGDTSLRNMSLAQLSDVYDMYRMVLTRVRDANKSFLNAKKEAISNLASRVVGEVKKVGGEHKYRAAVLDFVKKFGWNNLKPVYAFEHIGSATLTDAFSNVRAGEDTWAKDVTDARAYYLEKSNKYGYDSWDFKKKYSFESTSGIEFELTLEQILSLYAYSKRDQAHDHLRLGGFVFDSNIETYKEKDGKSGKSILKYRVNTADAHQITPEILADITGKLSKEQTDFVDEMQDYLSTVMGAKGNEVTTQMYGVKLFKEKFYFPLKSAKQFMFEQNEVSGEVRIKNSGFTNKVVAKANNPVILSNFMEVWANHVNDMSMYHSFVLPLEDFNRIFNYNSPKQEGKPPVSVKGTIQSAYSPAAVNYVRQLITDLNGGARTDPTTDIISKMMGLFKKGAVFASASVVVQQPSAIARAFALVDSKYFIGPKVDHKRHKALWEEVKQYAPVAIIKEMGYFDTNMGKSTQDFILAKEYSGIGEKMKALVTDSGYRDEILSKAPALADELAWCGIWEAVKRETKAKNPDMDAQSDEFLKKAGARFTEVITKTQVYDSVLSRSGLMRSKDTGMKMATAFMAEPTTSINMIADALLQGKRGNRRYARKTIGAVIAAQILNSILVSFVYAGRDDDEDETYIEKYVGTFTAEMLDGLNPATYIPFIKDIVSIVQGYDVERSDMAVISDLWNAIENLGKDNMSGYRKVESFVGSIAQIFGLPVKNIMRDARGLYQTIESFVNGQKTTKAGVGYAIKGAITGKTASDQQQLYEAYLSGDKEQIARVEGRFKDQTAINTAIRKALRENDPRIKEAAQAKFSGNLDEYMRIAKEILAEKHFSQDNVVAAINAEINALDNGETTTSAPKASGMFKTEDFAVAISQDDQAMANAIKTDIIQTAEKNGKTEDEAEKSFVSSAKTELKEMFLAGEITERQAVKALDTYCDMTEDDAVADVQYWAFKQDYPNIYVDDAWFDKYYDDVADSGILIDVYMKYRNQAKNITGEDKKERKMAIIDSLPITSAQKDALYYAEGWAESKLYEAPWH